VSAATAYDVAVEGGTLVSADAGEQLTGWPVVQDFELQKEPGFGNFVHRTGTIRAAG